MEICETSGSIVKRGAIILPTTLEDFLVSSSDIWVRSMNNGHYNLYPLVKKHLHLVSYLAISWDILDATGIEDAT